MLPPSAEVLGGGDPDLRETRTFNMLRLCPTHNIDFFGTWNPMPCVKWGLILLAITYASITVALMFVTVTYYMPGLKETQRRQGLVIDALSSDTGKSAVRLSSIASDSTDTNILTNMMYNAEMMQTLPLLQKILDVNRQELNATRLLLDFFGRMGG